MGGMNSISQVVPTSPVRDFPAARALWGIEEILSDLFPDLGEPRHIWKLDGPLEDAPYDETPTMALLHMAHVGLLLPI